VLAGCRSRKLRTSELDVVRSKYSLYLSVMWLHFQMEINILEISLDILAIWHTGGEFANVPGKLVEVF